jgi:hemerythrin
MIALRKIQVTTGVWWVEAPEAGLSILCGCPADVVKHLMKRGLILQAEANGVAYETGPNAILLSDVMLQNGVFCNMAEFPVLQMLYRQGMILPGHPNNTGRKPLLIGSREQVNAQLQYIYRGNYGLISEEEVVDAGLPEDQAHDFMRLKLRFAFGRIRHPRELLDVIPIEEGETPVLNGLTVRRRSLNVFEFTYKGETQTVDLNLAPQATYESPYPLGSHYVKREFFSVVHTGEGDGWDMNRPSMGSLIMYQGKLYLIDAGPNILFSLNALGIAVNELEGVFHTHSHDDHFAGLTTLMRADRRLKYFAPPLVRASVTRKLAALLSFEEESFTDYFDVHDLPLGQWTEIDGLEVMPVLSPHPVETSILFFRVFWEGGYKSYAHLADIASRSVLEGMVTDDPEAPGLSRAAFDKVMADYAIPADVKKIDAGGGLIHGSASDFSDDTSRKILLSHLARPLSDREREIGSGAPFGTSDILIPGHQNFVIKSAHDLLDAYFPGMPRHQLRMLLNTKLISFNPETILIKEGVVNDAVYLVLTGTVERLSSEKGGRNLLSAGSLVGEISGLHTLPSSGTYRALSFVQTLRLPCDVYIAFVKRNDLFAEISKLQESREYLRRTWLFGENISNMTLNKVAKSMSSRRYRPGEVIEPEKVGGMVLIRGGMVERRLGDEFFDRLSVGDFVGEDLVLFGTPGLFIAKAANEVLVEVVPIEVLRAIPVVRWKLFETFERRMRLLAETGRADQVSVRWHNEFSVGIQRIDAHHRRLFEIANTVFEAIHAKRGPDTVREAMNALIDYTHYHFDEEESLMARYGWPELADHKSRHKHLIERVKVISDELYAACPADIKDVMPLLTDWITQHILAEDRKFAPFLNERGVY